MTDWQAARPQYVSLDTPHGRLELTWPLPQRVNAEALEPVAGIMLQDPAPTPRLNGTLITIQRARQIVAGMRRTAAEPSLTVHTPRVQLAWLMWCYREGYTNPADRAILENWFADDPATLHPDDIETQRELLGMADEILALMKHVSAEKDAEIARLHAELDGLRQVPVEYAPTAALDAAMAADPAREDGTILRETGGERRAFEWRAATREWVRIP